MNYDIRGSVSRLLSNAASMLDGAEGRLRIGRYGEVKVGGGVLGSNSLATEGSYWTGSNPAVGTGIAATTSLTALVAASPTLILQNNDVAGGKNIIFDYLKIQVTSVPTTSSDWRYAVLTDTIRRGSSAGSTIVPANANAGVGAGGTIAQLFFGALVAATANASRIITSGVLRSVIPVVLDQYTFKAGSDNNGASGALQNGTAPLVMGVNVPPIVLTPQTSMLFYMYGTANAAAPTFEFSAGWAER